MVAAGRGSQDPNLGDEAEVGRGKTLDLKGEVDFAVRQTGASHREPCLRSGDLVSDRFRVVGFIAHGGMGEVYEAEDLDLGERVALKMLRLELATDPQAAERLKREIQLARQVTHRNVCRIFDVFRHRAEDAGGNVCEATGFTMELVPGETLADRLDREGAMPTGEALQLIRQMAAALDAAHRAGVIHRDFKSGNVMLARRTGSPGGVRVVVTDFGVARSATDSDPGRPRLTGDNLTLGTADYMAPEQAQGDEVTSACDIYALGVVMFEMVTGRRPHVAGTPVALLLRRLKEPPPSPKKLIPGLDPRWDEVIRICLARDPSQRFRTGTEVVAALEGPESRITAAYELDTGARPAVGGPRSPLWVVLAVVLLVCLGGAVAWLAKPVRDPPPDNGMPGPVQLTTWPGLEVDPCLSPAGGAIAFSSNRSGRFEIYVKQLTPGSRAVPLTSDGEQNFQPAWSPDGGWLVYASHGRKGVWLAPALGGTPRQLTSFGSHPEWSPDGEKVVFQSDATAELSAHAVHAMPPSTLWMVAAAGGEPWQVTRAGAPRGGHGAPAWSPDGQRLVFTSSDRRSSEIWTVQADGGGLVAVVEDSAESFDPRYSPDGSHVYFSAISEGERYGVWRVPVSARGGPTGPPVGVTTMGMASIRQFDISSDGSQMVHTALATASNLWSVPISPASHQTTGDPRPLTSGSGRFSRPTFSPDGALLASDRWHIGSREDIWIMDARGAAPEQVTLDPGSDTQASWSPGGKGVVFLSDRGGEWALWSANLDRRVETLLVDFSDDIDGVRMSPDGTRVAYHRATAGGATNLWVAAVEGGEARQLTFDYELMGYPCWSPDGRWIAFEVKRGDDDHVAVVFATGGDPQQLTTDRGKSWPYSWAPDNDKIAFAALRDGFWNVWWVSRSTGEQHQLTGFEMLNGYVRYPAWSPRGDAIVFERAETTGDLWLLAGLR